MNITALLKKYDKYSEAELEILYLGTFALLKSLELPPGHCVQAASRAAKELRYMCHPDERQKTERMAKQPARAFKIGWHDHSIRGLY